MFAVALLSKVVPVTTFPKSKKFTNPVGVPKPVDELTNAVMEPGWHELIAFEKGSVFAETNVLLASGVC